MKHKWIHDICRSCGREKVQILRSGKCRICSALEKDRKGAVHLNRKWLGLFEEYVHTDKTMSLLARENDISAASVSEVINKIARRKSIDISEIIQEKKIAGNRGNFLKRKLLKVIEKLNDFIIGGRMATQ